VLKLFYILFSNTFAIPYPAIVGVPLTAGCAPGRTRVPPSLRWVHANLALIDAGHTLDFHINSAFLMNSGEAGDPPAQPPARQRTASIFSPLRASATAEQTFSSYNL